MSSWPSLSCGNFAPDSQSPLPSQVMPSSNLHRRERVTEEWGRIWKRWGEGPSCASILKSLTPTQTWSRKVLVLHDSSFHLCKMKCLLNGPQRGRGVLGKTLGSAIAKTRVHTHWLAMRPSRYLSYLNSNFLAYKIRKIEVSTSFNTGSQMDVRKNYWHLRVRLNTILLFAVYLLFSYTFRTTTAALLTVGVNCTENRMCIFTTGEEGSLVRLQRNDIHIVKPTCHNVVVNNI